MSDQRKKEAKARKRKQRLQEKNEFRKKVERRKMLLTQYPAIVLGETGADPGFISLVRKAVGEIDFDDESQFSPWHREVFRHLATNGALATVRLLKAASESLRERNDPAGVLLLPEFVTVLGDRIFRAIPESDRREFLPYNDMMVYNVENRFEIRFSQLMRERGSHGTIYHSRHRPSIRVGQEDLVVGYSRHAIEQICERLNPRWLNYAAAGEVHAVFSHCTYFEFSILNDGGPAFTFFDLCHNEDFIQFQIYVNAVMADGEYDPSRGRAYYRVGYCPFVIEKGFAKAKTFLWPGFGKTPEHELIRDSRLPWQEKQRLLALGRSSSGDNVLKDEHVEAIRWAHRNGIPQVMQTQREIFNYS